MANAEWGLKGMVSVWRGQEDEASGAREPSFLLGHAPQRGPSWEKPPPTVMSKKTL